jgi:hypothetical protein
MLSDTGLLPGRLVTLINPGQNLSYFRLASRTPDLSLNSLTYCASRQPLGSTGFVTSLVTIRPPLRSWGIALTASSLIIMPVLGITKQRLGRRLGSGATAGEGIQNLMCAAQAAAVLVRPGRRRHLACRMAHRSGHRPGHRWMVRLGRPPGMARR